MKKNILLILVLASNLYLVMSNYKFKEQAENRARIIMNYHEQDRLEHDLVYNIILGYGINVAKESFECGMQSEFLEHDIPDNPQLYHTKPHPVYEFINENFK